MDCFVYEKVYRTLDGYIMIPFCFYILYLLLYILGAEKPY